LPGARRYRAHDMNPAHTPCSAADVPQVAYRDGQLAVEDVLLADLAAEHGTPLYVYSEAVLRERFGALRRAFGDDAQICYAVKANSNLSILRVFAELGAGFDLVSGGELARLEAAGIAADRAVFAGVAKERWEIEAALHAGIGLFNVESPHELELLAAAGRAVGRAVPLALRLNPDVDANTHDYISTGRKGDKFGLTLDVAAQVAQQVQAHPDLRLVGYHVHLGSQIRSATPYLEAFDKVSGFMAAAPAHREGVERFDLGGGFGIPYGDGAAPLDVQALGDALAPRIRAAGLRPVLEPGRYLVGDAGVFVTRILGQKTSGQRHFLLVDGAMNDLLRPSLYKAEHPVAPVRSGRPDRGRRFDVVGPVCESGDFLALGRALPDPETGDLLAVLAAGAYGACMASNYNSRRRPAEVLVAGAGSRLIRRRESFEELWAAEKTEQA